MKTYQKTTIKLSPDLTLKLQAMTNAYKEMLDADIDYINVRDMSDERIREQRGLNGTDAEIFQAHLNYCEVLRTLAQAKRLIFNDAAGELARAWWVLDIPF